MAHLTDPRIASDIQSIMFYAKAICDAASQLAQAPKGAPELATINAYFKEHSQTLRDILTKVEADLG